MADFQKALAITGHNEGGFCDRSQTTGEVVNRGVTLETLRRLGICKGPVPTNASNISQADIDFVKSMSVEETDSILQQEFWDKLNLDDINSQILANQLFDLAVNDGPSWPAWWLQDAVGTTPDGDIGKLTWRAANAADPATVLAAVRSKATAHYNVAEPAADRPIWLARLAYMASLDSAQV